MPRVDSQWVDRQWVAVRPGIQRRCGPRNITNSMWSGRRPDFAWFRTTGTDTWAGCPATAHAAWPFPQTKTAGGAHEGSGRDARSIVDKMPLYAATLSRGSPAVTKQLQPASHRVLRQPPAPWGFARPAQSTWRTTSRQFLGIKRRIEPVDHGSDLATCAWVMLRMAS